MKGFIASRLRGLFTVSGLAFFLGSYVFAQPFVPAEVGTSVNGFQDDFNGVSLGANWMVRGENVFSVSNGLLHVAPANGDPNHLLYELPGYNNSTQEVLVRMRVKRFGTGAYPRGGVAVGVSATDSRGINFSFRDDAGRNMAFLNDFLAWGTSQSFGWQTNVWYWLRLRQEVNAPTQGGADDVFAKIWLADGSVPEPANWQLSWNYSPALGTRNGFAGIMAGSEAGTQGGLSEFEADYVLIKAAGLPSIVVVPSAVAMVPAAITNQPQSTNVMELFPAMFWVGATGNPPPAYQWYRNSIPIPGATNADYMLASAALTNHGSLFKVVATNVVSNVVHSVTSSVATLTVNADVVAPTIIGAGSAGLTQVRVTFSERVTVASATSLVNYALVGPSGSVGILSAALDVTQTNVVLTVNPMVENTLHTLAVNGLSDLSAAANVIAPNSQVIFTPSNYQPCDIGNPVFATSITAITNGYDITAGGTDIGGMGDQFHFSFQAVSGDFDLNTRVESMTLADAWAKAGLMARETTNANSRFVSVLTSPSIVGSFFLARSTIGGSAVPSGSSPVNYPFTWLRLQRVGSLFAGYTSFDGQHWIQVGSITLSLPNTLYLGMAVASHSASLTTTAKFRNLSATTVASPETVLLPFEPLAPSSRRTGLVISEIMYHPESRADGKNLEFVELFNTSAFSEDLTGFRLSSAVDFAIPPGTILPAGGFLVIAKSPGDVQDVYGISGVLGPYTNNLPNDAGTLRLRNKQDSVLLEVNYDSHAPWPCAADGAGHSLILARASYGEADPRAWDISDVTGGSPGVVDAFRPSPLRSAVINELLANGGAAEDFVELYNASNETNDLSGCILTDNPDTNKFVVPPGTMIGPREFRVFTQSTLGFGLKAAGDTIYLKKPDGSRVLDAVRFEAQAENVSLGRWPNGANRFYSLATPTPASSNASIRVNDVIINELMYHPIFDNDDDQFIELFNPGTNNVNVGGWQLMAGVNYLIPPGTVMVSNSYLVVAKNVTNLLAKYPNLTASNTIGNFTGALSHGGERVALTKPQVNITTNGSVTTTNTLYVVVDEMTYTDGGRGTKWADGGGSSLELINPRANHRLLANWADSDESLKADWTTIEATGVLDLGMPDWSASAFNALLFEEGECLLDNVEVISGGNNLVANGTFESGTNGWFFEGNHERTSLETNGFGSARSIHLRATGGGDSYANRVRTSLTSAIPAGTAATLRAKVRWLRGNPEILLRLRGNWLEATGPLNVPANLGTPGYRNSRFVTNSGPALVDVTHTPALPMANQAVVVTVRADDPDGLSLVQLKYRIDPTLTFSTLTMSDGGTGGDAVAGDGIFSATIPGQAANTLVAFYVEATDGFASAAATKFPSDAPVRECLVRFGETQPFGSFGSYRLWLTQATFNRWASRRTTSDEPLDCTLVNGTQRVIYNVGVYYSGSPWKSALSIIDTPTGNMCDYNLRLPTDDRLLGSAKLKISFPGNVDVNNQGVDQTAQMEPTSYWVARQLGIPTGSLRHINFFINGIRRGSIIYDVQIPDSSLVQEVFPDGDRGDLFEGSFWFEADGVDAGLFGEYYNSFATMTDYRTTGGVKKKARYRWNFPRHGVGGSANNYTNWFALVDALNAQTNYTSGVEALVDVEQWMRVFAYEHLVNNWEAFGFSHGVNMFAYKGRQGRWTLIPNDVDISFLGSPSDLFSVDDPVLQRMVDHPPFRRAYWRALQDAADGPLQSVQVNALCDPRYAALQANGVTVSSPGGIKSFISTMRSQVLSQLNSVAASFTVNGPATFTTNQTPVTLTGSAPIKVAKLTINGNQWPVTWTGVTSWTMTVPLVPGSNIINIVGLDNRDQAVGGASATVTINFTGTNPPAPPKIFINEWMASNTGFVRDPADNDADDWFELFNPSTSPVNLAGWFLSDTLTNRFQFTVPARYTIPAQGYLLVWADDELQQNSTNQPDLHVNFKMDKDGEAIVLSTTNGTVMDSVVFGFQTNNISQGRYRDGGTNLFFLTTPTPRGTNIFVPVAPSFSAVTTSGGDVALRFSGTPGIDYLIQFKNQLDDPSWTPLGTPTMMTGTNAIVTDHIGSNSQRFYRLLLLP